MVDDCVHHKIEYTGGKWVPLDDIARTLEGVPQYLLALSAMVLWYQ